MDVLVLRLAQLVVWRCRTCELNPRCGASLEVGYVYRLAMLCGRGGAVVQEKSRTDYELTSVVCLVQNYVFKCRENW